MYEELVKRLRSHDRWALNKTLDEAADAIEELSILAQNGEAAYSIMVSLTNYVEELKQNMPHWTSVTEALPQKENRTYWICTDTGYQYECRWTNNRFGIGESDEWGWSIVDVPQYHKVVAWMFLPKPYELPKED